jgi:excinuclease ABC subunit A
VQAEQQALHLLLEEIRTRLKYLCDVGIGYLSLDRQSRTLSGGEVQRINLTTALGTSLVNTLFVLDEPSIGLHPRDMHRITQAMLRLRDAGNTLVVVEHDPAVMLAADRIVDMGPGPGERGGQVVFDGTPEGLKQADTLTGAYLGARKQVGVGLKRLVSDATPRLILEGAREHNLQHLNIEFPVATLGHGHRGEWIGQIHLDPRHLGTGFVAALWQEHGRCGCARPLVGRRPFE